MTRNYCPFKGPFLDSYSVGFRLYQPDAINWRHRTIAGVSWNGEEQEAFFFNPDGLVLPLKPNPWELPQLIGKNAVRREFSSIHGSGHFAMKQGRRAALKSLDLNDWVTYWLVDQSAGYANDPAVWQRITEQDLAEEKTASERLHREMKLTSDLSGYIDECLAERRDLLAAKHRRRCVEDNKILAWLKGETPQPLFTCTQEAA
ncbi:hypothetical protein SAMN04490202_2402 [Pseudomonas reinekei]|uniref:Uncharacterized protein n=1 Tax=Pseudomonas reinekei TaxID=395598 RepID=A0A1H0NW12_PSERE|nr:hypothetical protein [Pseudomonas reinekei]KAB0482825.1 hypothetical protein F7R15_22565 [Pseudomonas reinekei]OLU00227.1 hypothetical protein BVK86_22825 [Pseudomonas reinekei]SDO96706.1 hypothetical protein SAMN04490202_2402 [Pseudomonas reinekei]